MSRCQPHIPPSTNNTNGLIARDWALTTYRQGVDAAKAGLPATGNPYEDGSDQAAVWQGGWEAGSVE